MRTLTRILLVLALVAGAAGCRYNAGPFAADGGVVACVASVIDAAGKSSPVAHGAVYMRSGSCDGPGVPGYIGVDVSLWLVVGGDPVVKQACTGTGWVHLSNSEGFTLTTPQASASTLEVCQQAQPSTRWQSRTTAAAWLFGTLYTSDPTWSPFEEWTLPASNMAELVAYIERVTGRTYPRQLVVTEVPLHPVAA